MFKLLHKYRPETKAQKKERLKNLAEQKVKSGSEAQPPQSKKPIVVKYGINHITSLVEEKKAQLIVIANDVDPIEVREHVYVNSSLVVTRTWSCYTASSPSFWLIIITPVFILPVELITLHHVLLGIFILIDCCLVTGTLSEDGCSLLHSEEQGKVSYH